MGSKTYNYQPRFADPISPWVKWFAWRPVNTEDYGWQWLKSVYKRRCQTKDYLDGPTMRWWQYARLEPEL